MPLCVFFQVNPVTKLHHWRLTRNPHGATVRRRLEPSFPRNTLRLCRQIPGSLKHGSQVCSPLYLSEFSSEGKHHKAQSSHVVQSYKNGFRSMSLVDSPTDCWTSALLTYRLKLEKDEWIMFGLGMSECLASEVPRRCLTGK